MGAAVGGAPGDAGSAAGGLRTTERSGEGVERPKGGLALSGEHRGEEMGDGVLCSLWFSWCRTVTVIIETVGVVLFSHWCWEDYPECVGDLAVSMVWRTCDRRDNGELMAIQTVEDSWP